MFRNFNADYYSKLRIEKLSKWEISKTVLHVFESILERVKRHDKSPF